ncbi:MAG: aminopeptidase [bacterium]|nr:aminopeptidase [bacterium]
MFDLEAYYSPENSKIDYAYRQLSQVIEEIARETSSPEAFSGDDHYREYFHTLAEYFTSLIALERQVSELYYRETSFDALYRANHEFFRDLLPSEYTNSYCNPAFAVDRFGMEIGRLLATFSSECRRLIFSAHHHERFVMYEYLEAFCEGYRTYCEGKRSDSELRAPFTKPARTLSVEKSRISVRKRFDPTYKLFHSIVEECCSSDKSYLFRYGVYISDNEIRTAEFIDQLPQSRIVELAKLIANAYQTGFAIDNKNLSDKSTVCLSYPIGYERIVQQIAIEFEALQLQIVNLSPTGTVINRQYLYDHRFSNALVLDRAYAEKALACTSTAYELEKANLSAYSGIVLIETFGEPTFQPVEQPASLRYSEEQQEIYQDLTSRRSQLYYTYIPASETSFAMIAFPSPEIGERYEEMFNDIYAVNTLESDKYLQLQEKLITILDQAVSVEVKGTNGNRTDITVAMQELHNPNSNSNFINCGADVNIPVGEVFTSPQLAGTNGVLHIGQTYLNSLEYIDLQLTFRDGYIVTYDCNNFNDPNANRKYIEENLLFPHQTLPLGEFAIGTNTLAYTIAHKYSILPILPILIIEKMGPHFAIGDTCFVHAEDVPVYNPLTKKEMVARDNTKSIGRKTDKASAYTNRHTDITLPYESIGLLTAVTREGNRIDLMRNGRFVLPGLEELNEPLDRLTLHK